MRAQRGWVPSPPSRPAASLAARFRPEPTPPAAPAAAHAAATLRLAAPARRSPPPLLAARAPREPLAPVRREPLLAVASGSPPRRELLCSASNRAPPRREQLCSTARTTPSRVEEREGLGRRRRWMGRRRDLGRTGCRATGQPHGRRGASGARRCGARAARCHRQAQGLEPSTAGWRDAQGHARGRGGSCGVGRRGAARGETARRVASRPGRGPRARRQCGAVRGRILVQRWRPPCAGSGEDGAAAPASFAMLGPPHHTTVAEVLRPGPLPPRRCSAPGHRHRGGPQPRAAAAQTLHYGAPRHRHSGHPGPPRPSPRFSIRSLRVPDARETRETPRICIHRWPRRDGARTVPPEFRLMLMKIYCHTESKKNFTRAHCTRYHEKSNPCYLLLNLIASDYQTLLD